MIAELLSDYITQVISSIGYLGVFDLGLITIIGAAGCMAGSVISYYAGLKGGRPFLEKYGKSRNEVH